MEGSRTTPVVVEEFEVTTGETHVVAQISDLASGLGNRLKGIEPDRVLIRRADQRPKPSNTEGPRVRLLVEGALAAEALRTTTDVELLVGKDVAARTEYRKAELDARSSELVSDPLYLEAASAAIAALDS